jgi:hypothetical protein
LLQPAEARLNEEFQVGTFQAFYIPSLSGSRMIFRICSVAISAGLLLSSSAQAQVPSVPSLQVLSLQVRSPMKMSDERSEFVRLCVPHMTGRWAHPESVCSCLHDYAAATVDDADLRTALLRGIS